MICQRSKLQQTLTTSASQCWGNKFPLVTQSQIVCLENRSERTKLNINSDPLPRFFQDNASENHGRKLLDFIFAIQPSCLPQQGLWRGRYMWILIYSNTKIKNNFCKKRRRDMLILNTRSWSWKVTIFKLCHCINVIQNKKKKSVFLNTIDFLQTCKIVVVKKERKLNMRSWS